MTADQKFNWNIDIGVQKYDEEAVTWLTERLGRAPQGADFEDMHIAPYEDNVHHGNLLTTAGLTRITSLITGGGGQTLINTSGRIGVGNSSTAAAVGQTDLQAVAGAANRWFNILDATFPTVAAGVITLKSTFLSADGNFAWNEFGIDIGAPTAANSAVVAATLLNRAVISQGTKTSGQSWTASATITLS